MQRIGKRLDDVKTGKGGSSLGGTGSGDGGSAVESDHGSSDGGKRGE